MNGRLTAGLIAVCGVSIAAGCVREPADPPAVVATVGTVPVGGADGVAIWPHPTNPSKSTVIGAQPRRGLTVFSLDGKVIQKLKFAKGGAGEVDVRGGFPLGGKRVTLAAGGVKNGRRIYAYRIDAATGRLENVLVDPPPATGVNPYGSCLYRSATSGRYYLFITSKAGVIEQYELSDNGAGRVAAAKVRTIRLTEGTNRVVEACVADDRHGVLFVAQENECMIWRYNAEPDGGDSHVLVDDARIAPGDNVEGLAICRTPKGRPTSGNDGYLIASLQGSWQYKVYTLRPPHAYLGRFAIATAGGNGKVRSHDCIEVTPQNLGAAFPGGLFVTQNANNPGGKHYQLVPWESIARRIEWMTRE